MYICLNCGSIKNIFSKEKKFPLGNNLLFSDLHNDGKYVCYSSKKKNRVKTTKKSIKTKIMNSKTNEEKIKYQKDYEKYNNSITNSCKDIPIISFNMIGNIITIPDPTFFKQSNKFDFLELKHSSFIICPICARFTILDYNNFSNICYDCKLPRYNNINSKLLDYYCFKCKSQLLTINDYDKILLFDDLNAKSYKLFFFCKSCSKNYKKFTGGTIDGTNKYLNLSQFLFITDNDLNFKTLTECEDLLSDINTIK